MSVSLEHPSFTGKKAKWGLLDGPRPESCECGSNACPCRCAESGHCSCRVPGGADWVTGCDSEDAWFCIPLREETQPLSAFAWTSPSRPQSAQLTWTALPQGCRNSPQLLGAALSKDLSEMPSSEGTVIQHADGTLTCGPTEETTDKDSITLLNFLAERGYRASPIKAQISLQKVHYLGHELTHQVTLF